MVILGTVKFNLSKLAESPLLNPDFDLNTIIRVTIVRFFIEECLDLIPLDLQIALL
jgi:hypothetical protein